MKKNKNTKTKNQKETSHQSQSMTLSKNPSNQWLDITKHGVGERPLGIGGTDAARIVEGDWKNLYNEKLGFQDREDLSNVLPVQMGIHTESLNRQWYNKQTGCYVKHTADVIVNCNHKFMFASLDGMVEKNNELMVWDAKHTNAFMKRDKLVEKYYPQMQHYMFVTELKKAVLSVFYGNLKWEEIIIEQDKEFQWSLLKAELMFWNMFENNVEPPDHMDWENFTKESYNEHGNITIPIISRVQEEGNESKSS